MPDRIEIPRLVVAGTASGVGKTTFTVGLVRALRSRGLKVAVFKCGPDYLDPTYHARAAGTTAHNLDAWMMGRDAVLGTFARSCADADIAVIEGVMGLFDGVSPTTEEGSTAEIAKWLDAPVMLVVDVSGMARTVAAIARGVAAFDPKLRVAGILCNRVGSRGHLDILRSALSDLPVLGGLPNEPAVSFPERHLGLRTADEQAVPDSLLAALERVTGQWCDLDAILTVARTAPLVSCQLSAKADKASPSRCRIGVAFDEAFHFYYEFNLHLLESLGAELVYFSPISDRRLPDVNGLYIGGGYPEIHAEALSANRSMREQIAAFAARGATIYGECGGLMYMCSAITAVDGQTYPMVGVIPAQAIMRERLQALGYVEVETQSESVLGPAGLRFRGHQFRYSELRPLNDQIACAYRMVRRRDGQAVPEGYTVKNTLASYVHAHWASNPTIAERLVDACVHQTRTTNEMRQ
ncbi:MAG TPA: cobyrinate a,c-diamide synthase [Candidatus Binataceae bacterium]|nr:cobyrinate a,c-diamide synthase [Candidatus Binataceae bacterium]